MVAPAEDIERRLVDETQMRRSLVLAYFPQQEVFAHCEEVLHDKLAMLDPQQLRDPKTLSDLKDELTEEIPLLGKKIEGTDMAIYDLLLNIAEGKENFSPPPLSAHRDASLR